jgi:hypothetical protein
LFGQRLKPGSDAEFEVCPIEDLKFSVNLSNKFETPTVSKTSKVVEIMSKQDPEPNPYKNTNNSLQILGSEFMAQLTSA